MSLAAVNGLLAYLAQTAHSKLAFIVTDTSHKKPGCTIQPYWNFVANQFVTWKL